MAFCLELATFPASRRSLNSREPQSPNHRLISRTVCFYFYSTSERCIVTSVYTPLAPTVSVYNVMCVHNAAYNRQTTMSSRSSCSDMMQDMLPALGKSHRGLFSRPIGYRMICCRPSIGRPLTSHIILAIDFNGRAHATKAADGYPT